VNNDNKQNRWKKNPVEEKDFKDEIRKRGREEEKNVAKNLL
jgi:hypothetical protein